MTETESSTYTLTVAQALQQAIDHHQAGHLQEAERLYCAILGVEPLHPDANHNLGLLAVQTNQAGVGLPYFKIALEANSSLDQYWISYIDALIQVSQPDLARQFLEEGRRRGLAGPVVDALELRSAAPTATEINEVVELFNRGNYSEGEVRARDLTERFPQHGFGWKALGPLLMAQERVTQALVPMQIAAELLPMDAEVQSNLGNAQVRLGHLQEAEACYLKSQAINPDFLAAKNGLDLVRQEHVRVAEAKARYEREKEHNQLVVAPDGAQTLRPNPLGVIRGNKTLEKIITFFGGGMFILGMFLMWGKADSNSSKQTFAAKVNGTEISMAAFTKSYTRNRDLNRDKFGAAFTPELEAKLALRKTTLDALIHNELLYNQAVGQGLKISDEEVIHSIAMMPAFQKNGAFDMELYQQVLLRNNMTPHQFEKSHKKDLLAEKARLAVVASVQVSEQDLKEQFHKEHDTIIVSYLSVTPRDVWSDSTVSNAECTEYYEKNRSLFLTEGKVAVAYIRVPVGKNNITTVLEKVADARYKYSQKGDLKPVAQALGVPLRTSRMFASSTPPPEFVGSDSLIKKIFALKEDETGGPFETATAVYLVKVTGRQVPEPASFDAVRKLIEQAIRTDKARLRAKLKAEESLQQLSKGISLPGLRESNPFSYNIVGNIPGIGTSPELMEEVLLLTSQHPVGKKIYGDAAHWYAVRLKQRLPASEDGIGVLKDGLKQRLMNVKQQKVLDTWFAEQRRTAHIEINKQISTAITKDMP